jgi:hypothetical protein
MIQTIKKIAIEAVESMQPLELMEAEVTSASPNLEIKLKSNAKLLIPNELINVAEHLTNHKRQIRVNGGTVQTYEFMDELKVGDKIMVASYQGGQSFFIVDRVK